MHIYPSHYFQTTLNDQGVLERQNWRKSSFSMIIVATDENCYMTLLVVTLISPAWIVYSHWTSTQWFQLTDVHPCNLLFVPLFGHLDLQSSPSHIYPFTVYLEKRRTHDTLHRPRKNIRNIICSCWHTEFSKPPLQAFSDLFDHLPPFYRSVHVTCSSAVCSMKGLKFLAQSRS